LAEIVDAELLELLELLEAAAAGAAALPVKDCAADIV